VQVACTINYDRTRLWKQIAEIGLQSEMGLQRRCRDSRPQPALSGAEERGESNGAVRPSEAQRAQRGRTHPGRALTIPSLWARINMVPAIKTFISPYVGLWRSWERASMAWKRSSVRSRPGPPSFQQLSGPPSPIWPEIGRKSSKTFHHLSRLSQFSVDCFDRCLHAFWNLLHVDIGRGCQP
jgi:hypothetical protein